MSKLICEHCKKEVEKVDMFDWSVCNACYNQAMNDEVCIQTIEHMRDCKRCTDMWEEMEKEREFAGLCGKPENHDNGETEGCVECLAIKNNV